MVTGLKLLQYIFLNIDIPLRLGFGINPFSAVEREKGCFDFAALRLDFAHVFLLALIRCSGVLHGWLRQNRSYRGVGLFDRTLAYYLRAAKREG